MASQVERFVKQYLIFVDSSSLMCSDAENFFNKKFIPVIKKYNSKYPKETTGFYVLKSVENELKKFTEEEEWKTKIQKNGKPLPEKQISYRIYASLRAQKIINKWKKNNIVHIGKRQMNGHADHEFLTVFQEHSYEHNLLLITQDNNLAYDILDIKKRKSTYTKKIKVIKIEDSSSFNHFSKPPLFKKQPISLKKAKKVIKPFSLSKRPMIAKSLATSIIPISGEIVLDRNGEEIKIKEQLHKDSKGGEGIVYKTSNGSLCKIYHKEKITDLRIEKLKLMQLNQIEINNVMWPEKIAYNINKEAVGCFIKEAPSDCKDMLRIFNRPLQEQYFPNFKRKDLVNICIKILDTFYELHKYNIIVGDVNPSNILVTSKGKPYFIDTDSYQIEKFPCPVGKPHFTSPDILDTRSDKILRNKEDENFAIISLIFMTLLPGKAPFSYIGGGTPAENVRNKNFSYPFRLEIKQKEWESLKDHHKEKIVDCLNKQIKFYSKKPKGYWSNLEEDSPIIFESLSSNTIHSWDSTLVSEFLKNSKSKSLEFRDYNGKRPEGVWGPIWSHLPYRVKKGFYKTFRLGIYTPIEDWIRTMKWYKTKLSNAEDTNPNFDMINEIYQTEFKIINKDTIQEYK
jgi:hypothetical protein|tara:strand:+ start:451 stop:2325 length:1875 start_codon:yes stop_codon:yes gene_type:complete